VTETFGTITLVGEAVAAPTRRALRRFARNRLAVAAALVLVLLVLFAFAGPWLWRWDHRVHAEIPSDLAPRWSHPFGTTRAGHDLLGQVMRGTQQSLKIGALTALLTAVVGTAWGALAGYYRGWVDSVLMRIVDVMLVLPLLVVVLVLAGPSGTTWWHVALVVGCFASAGTARIIRGVALAVREREFVEAARALGASDLRILVRHVVPHTTSYVVIDALFAATGAILIEAALSFVGFGISAPDTSLGLQVANAETAVTTRPWLFYFPGGFLIALCLVINLAGDGLRDALDPRNDLRRRDGA
jgi:peptide/nickel transport system permease protein